jgi:hypothetical protein
MATLATDLKLTIHAHPTLSADGGGRSVLRTGDSRLSSETQVQQLIEGVRPSASGGRGSEAPSRLRGRSYHLSTIRLRSP